jgi:RNA recognition motif-containing protein
MEQITARMGAVSLKPDHPKHSNLYVSGLGPSLSTEADLTELFAPYGHVETVRIVRNSRDTKSFAFVKMSTVPESLAAIAGVNKKPVGGIVLEVKTADAGTAGQHSAAAWHKDVSGTLTDS